MSSLSFRPRRRRGGRLLWGVLLLMGVGLVVWYRGWLPDVLMAQLRRQVQQYTPPAVAAQLSQLQLQSAPTSIQQSTAVSAETVALVETNVIENPHSAAHTAALYESGGTKDSIPWLNIAGRTEVITYTVQSGDTLWSIADQFGLELDTLRWSNTELERNPDVLSIGTELKILPVNGSYHIVEVEDTLASIATRYGVSEATITDYPPNGMYPPYDLEVGQGLIIPLGNKERELPKPSISADYPLAWPLVSPPIGTFSTDHPALDIGAPYGATVYAAQGGLVIAADWSENYGYRVILDHGSGFHTWYAHLKGTPLRVGLAVPRGTPVGEVGSTGRSTGPHLHFEVRINNDPVDPLAYLPPEPQ